MFTANVVIQNFVMNTIRRGYHRKPTVKAKPESTINERAANWPGVFAKLQGTNAAKEKLAKSNGIIEEQRHIRSQLGNRTGRDSGVDND